MRIDRFQRSEFAIQKLPDKLAEKSAVVREPDLLRRDSFLGERPCKQFNLRALSGAVNPLDNNEFPASRHRFSRVYHTPIPTPPMDGTFSAREYEIDH